MMNKIFGCVNLLSPALWVINGKLQIKTLPSGWAVVVPQRLSTPLRRNNLQGCWFSYHRVLGSSLLSSSLSGASFIRSIKEVQHN